MRYKSISAESGFTTPTLLRRKLHGSERFSDLTKRAYYSNIEKGFIRTVLDITANISGKIEDEEIPKFISEIIVKDIKKDKRLKGKK